MRTRLTWVEIPCKRSSDDSPEVITVEVMEDGAALPRGARFEMNRPPCGQIRTFVTVEGQVKAIDLDALEER